MNIPVQLTWPFDSQPWRPLSERSAVELRAQAAEYRRMAATATTERVMRSLYDLADRFDGMADQRGQNETPQASG
jgi:hypothetical protein